MAYFPQLSTGSIAQYPLTRERRVRSVRNESSDGRMVKLGDPDSETLRWNLYLSGLTDEEWGAIGGLFEACEGQLGTFTFLDPSGNLLAWSEKLSEQVWQKGPLVEVTEGISDPFGTERASRIHNASATAQRVEQSLAVKANFHYSFSLYARSDQASSVTLTAAAASASDGEIVWLSAAWKRHVFSVHLDAGDEAVDFGLEIASGASVEVFGLQVEAQPGASAYKKTDARGGIHARARFADDALTVTTEGPDRHALVVRILAALKD